MGSEIEEDAKFWEDFLAPFPGYRLFGWTYRKSATLISPDGEMVYIDESTVKLVNSRKSA